jgi:hypothetical protein
MTKPQTIALLLTGFAMILGWAYIIAHFLAKYW